MVSTLPLPRLVQPSYLRVKAGLTFTPCGIFSLSCRIDGTPATQINRVVCHPTLPVMATAHEDRYIRFYDKNTGKVTHSMTAHPEAVAALTFDPHGLYLLSGGEQ